jgi:hypothetical protein
VTAIALCLAGLSVFNSCSKDDDPINEPGGNTGGSGNVEAGRTYVSTSPNGEQVYTLKITEIADQQRAAAQSAEQSALRAASEEGDTYVLLYVDKSGVVRTSAGEVTLTDGDDLTLAPSYGAPFTVTVTDNGITNIVGNVAFEDGSNTTGGTLTPLANGEIEITGESIIVNGQEQMQLKDERVLGVPGMAINYVYNGKGLLSVKEGKTLIVLPGTTIRFTQPEGGIITESDATIKMLGEDKLRELDAEGNLSAVPGTKSGHITLKGGANKGSWHCVTVTTDKDNQFSYVDFINGGSNTHPDVNAVLLVTSRLDTNVKASISHCKISGGLANGIKLGFNVNLTAFNNNTVENVDAAPVFCDRNKDLATTAGKLDMTSDFTNNTNKYVEILPVDIDADVTFNKTSVPYYFNQNPFAAIALRYSAKFTINEGVTIYMSNASRFDSRSPASIPVGGSFVINGTEANPVTITRLPGATTYWDCMILHSAGNIINNCILEYGGKYEYMLNIAAHNAEVTMNNVIIRNSANKGIYLGNYGDVPNITQSNVTFANNQGCNVADYRVTPDQCLDAMP